MGNWGGGQKHDSDEKPGHHLGAAPTTWLGGEPGEALLFATVESSHTSLASIHPTGICGRVGRALARDALCRGFDPCRRRPRGLPVDFGPKQSGWLINQLGSPSLQGHFARLLTALELAASSGCEGAVEALRTAAAEAGGRRRRRRGRRSDLTRRGRAAAALASGPWLPRLRRRGDGAVAHRRCARPPAAVS